MSNFTGNEYLTTTIKNPYDYYWEQIDKSLSASTRNEDAKKRYRQSFEDALSEAASNIGIGVKDKKMYAQLCFKACQAVLVETIFSCGKPPYIGYALEYFVTAPTIFDLGENPRKINFNQREN